MQQMSADTLLCVIEFLTVTGIAQSYRTSKTYARAADRVLGKTTAPAAAGAVLNTNHKHDPMPLLFIIKHCMPFLDDAQRRSYVRMVFLGRRRVPRMLRYGWSKMKYKVPDKKC